MYSISWYVPNCQIFIAWLTSWLELSNERTQLEFQLATLISYNKLRKKWAEPKRSRIGSISTPKYNYVILELNVIMLSR
jgi:hypothetical protein